MSRIVLVFVSALLAASCTRAEEQGRAIVASFYPLAYAAERIAGPGWRVVDLTPPGTEAHDVELSLDDREAIATADLVLYLGTNGFQPQVEQAVVDAEGAVRGIDDDLSDPHLWLSPRTYLGIAATVRDALVDVAGNDDSGYRQRFDELAGQIEALDREYSETLGRCRYRTMIVSHEAFGHLARDYGLIQFGLTGLTPEGEPTAHRLREASAIVARGEADAIFYEPTVEGSRVGRQVAQDLGIRALPLSPVESRPMNGDFLASLRTNLESLRGGLQCR